MCFVERDGQQRVGLPVGVGKDRQHDAGDEPNGKTRGFEVGHLHDMHSKIGRAREGGARHLMRFQVTDWGSEGLYERLHQLLKRVKACCR